MVRFWNTFTFAAGPHWVRTGVVTGTGVYAAVTGVEGLLAQHGFPIEPNAPKVLFTIGALGLLVIFWLWKYAHDLRLAAEPRIQPSFEPDMHGIEPAVVKDARVTAYGVPFDDGDPTSRLANYIRITVNAASDCNVPGCSAAIIGLGKRKSRENKFTEQSVPQPIQMGPEHFTVRAGIPFLIDFLVADERNEILAPVQGMNWPYILEDFLDDVGTYQFDIAVNDGRKSKIIRLEIDYDGHWNGIAGRQISVK